MMNLSDLLTQVKQAIFNDPTTPHREGHDPSGLIGQIEGLFGQHQASVGNQQIGGSGYAVTGNQNVRPASEDPLGDPADQQRFGNVRPASEDPLGDPADRQ
jgi:hypothetical protein